MKCSKLFISKLSQLVLISLRLCVISSHGPSNMLNAHICIKPQRIPNSFGPIHNIVTARWLTRVLRVAPVHRVTLVHHFRRHAPPVPGGDPNHPATPRPSVVPPGGQRHHSLGVVMVLLVTLRGTPSVPTFAEIVQGEDGLCRGRNWWRAPIIVV